MADSHICQLTCGLDGFVHPVHSTEMPLGHEAPSRVVATSKGKARFKVRYRLDDTQSSKTFGDERGARDFAELLDVMGPAEAVLILDERQSAPTGVPTFGDYAYRHVDSLTGVQPERRRRLHRFVDRDLSDKLARPVTAISDATVGTWVNGLGRARASGKTIRKKTRRPVLDPGPCRAQRADRLQPRRRDPAASYPAPADGVPDPARVRRL